MQAAQVIPMYAPAELLAFRQRTEFAYLRGGLTCPYNPADQLSPLWGGAAGGHAPSTLDDGQVGPVVAQHEASRLLMVEEEDRMTSEFNVVTSRHEVPGGLPHGAGIF